tara:strand:- start:2549 stop:2761 length:213 start_codon:yes stop_codon:yes gene_type:complete
LNAFGAANKSCHICLYTQGGTREVNLDPRDNVLAPIPPKQFFSRRQVARIFLRGSAADAAGHLVGFAWLR